jgi:hypothetical protein
VFKRAALNGGEELIEFLGGSQKNALSDEANDVMLNQLGARHERRWLNHTDARFHVRHVFDLFELIRQSIGR